LYLTTEQVYRKDTEKQDAKTYYCMFNKTCFRLALRGFKKKGIGTLNKI